MKTIKEAGTEEIRALRSRTSRSLAMGRISREDHDFIVEKCDEIEARIQQMREIDPKRREF